MSKTTCVSNWNDAPNDGNGARRDYYEYYSWCYIGVPAAFVLTNCATTQNDKKLFHYCNLRRRLYHYLTKSYCLSKERCYTLGRLVMSVDTFATTLRMKWVADFVPMISRPHVKKLFNSFQVLTCCFIDTIVVLVNWWQSVGHGLHY
jgi:hypothetical protein